MNKNDDTAQAGLFPCKLMVKWEIKGMLYDKFAFGGERKDSYA